MNEVQQLINNRILELKSERGLTLAEVSRRMRRNPTYLQQFIVRGVPKELDEQDRYLLAAILELNPDQLRGPGKPRRATFKQGSFAKKTSLTWVKPSAFDELQVNAAPGNGGVNTKAENAGLPVYQTVQEGGNIVMARRPFTVFQTPLINLGADSYCVIVADDSMAPEHRRGSLAIVDPSLEVQIETTCLFRESAKLEDGGTILIRRIKEIGKDSWTVYAHHKTQTSKLEQVLPKSKFPVCHVTVGNIFRV
jgi:hypothetical protein